MPIGLLAALIGSLALHAAALFGADFELPGNDPEPQALNIELRPLPPPPPAAAALPKTKAATTKRPLPASSAVPGVSPQALAPAASPGVPAASVENASPEPSTAEVVLPAPPAPAKPRFPAQGVIRYVVSMGSQGFYVGRAEHRWEFTADGHYRLQGMMETTGLVSLFKSLRFENESRGRLTARGLEPDSYRTLKNGRDGNENADFDWPAGVVRLARDGSVREISPGSQDILSLNYQLAYLAAPEQGAVIGVMTGKKYERYALDSLGEEELETPAGHFRTLHLRAMTENVTEIWIALDRYRLPVKIRFTDKKGDSFEQLVTAIGSAEDQAP